MKFNKRANENLVSGHTVQSIIMIALIVTIILFFVFVFPKLTAGTDWYELSATKQTEITDNFNYLIKSLEECAPIKDTGCICKNILPNFPASFPKEVTLKLEPTGTGNADTIITLAYNEQNIMNKTVKTSKIFLVENQKSENVPGNEVNEGKNKDELKEIKYDKIGKDGYPTFKTATNSFKIHLPHIYKYNYFYNLDFLYIDTIGDFEKQKAIADVKVILDNLPVCTQNRETAIKQFDDFVNSFKAGEKGDYTIQLSDKYSIFYGDKILMLKYKEKEDYETVKKYDKEQEKTNMVSYNPNYNVKCIEPKASDYLSNGDKINIKKTADGFCIEKL